MEEAEKDLLGMRFDRNEPPGGLSTGAVDEENLPFSGGSGSNEEGTEFDGGGAEEVRVEGGEKRSTRREGSDGRTMGREEKERNLISR